MSTAAAAQLIANHDARVKFLATMWEGGLDTTEDMAGQVSSLMAAISLEGDVDVQPASEVGRAFNQGPWTKEQKKLLSRALGDQVAATDQATGAEGKKQAKRKNQTCNNFEDYLTENMWESFEAKEDQTVHVEAMGTHMYNLGLVCPSEDLLKRAAAIIQMAGLGEEYIGGERRRKLCLDIQKKDKGP